MIMCRKILNNFIKYKTIMSKENKIEKVTYKGINYEPLSANVLDLKVGDEYLFDNGILAPEWTLCKIQSHINGIGVELLEGRQKRHLPME